MNKRFKAFLALLGFSGCSLLLAQVPVAPNIGPTAFSFNGSAGTLAIRNIAGQSYCTVSVDSTSTMGGGSITLKTSNDNGVSYFNVTGVADLGSGSGPSQTITLAGTQLTAPVSGKTNFEIVLSGGSNSAITGNILCGNGSGNIAQTNSISSLPPVTLVTPVTVNCQSPACTVTTPAPATTISPGLFVGITNACPSTAPAAINGAYTCTNDSTGRLQVSTPVPYTTANASFPAGLQAQDVIGSGGNLVPAMPVGCNNSFTWSTTSAGTITAVASAAGIAIYVCGWVLSSTAGTTSISSSSSASCGSSTALYSSIAGVSSQDSSSFWRGLGGPKPLLGLELCIILGSGTSGATGTIYFATASPGP